MSQGIVKSYDPNTGIGVVLDEESKEEIYLTKDSLKDSIFRTLRQGQRINYTKQEQDEHIVATKIRIGQDEY